MASLVELVDELIVRSTHFVLATRRHGKTVGIRKKIKPYSRAAHVQLTERIESQRGD